MGRTQARVVMGVLVAAVLGGSAELARSPQIVSFSRTASPFVAATQSTAGQAEFQAVAFRERNGMIGAPHETLLKASMPVNRAADVAGSANRTKVPVKKTVIKRHRVPPVLESRVAMPQRRGTERLIVMTSWEEMGPPRLVFAVAEQSVSSSSYAAVRTPGGWLVFQL